MSDPSGWDRPTRVEINGRSVSWADVAKAVAYIGAMVVLCGGIVIWRGLTKVRP